MHWVFFFPYLPACRIVVAGQFNRLFFFKFFIDETQPGVLLPPLSSKLLHAACDRRGQPALRGRRAHGAARHRQCAGRWELRYTRAVGEALCSLHGGVRRSHANPL